jgi:periplasmic divalent cation tolerance protein
MTLIVFTTTPISEADDLAAAIVEAKHAGCVQIVPSIRSIYVWQGEVQKEDESLLLIKTLPEKYVELEAFIKANHSYDVPEIVAVDAERVSDAYLEWLSAVVKDQ